MSNGYDIIGDIHGHGDALITLLTTLGYRNEDGCYRHPTRKAVFLGDFIDRGPSQRGVLQTVMPMVRGGAALAVMGNHEFNAIGYHTTHKKQPEQWLRPRNDKNTRQHLAFLAEYLAPGREAELKDALDFFRSLPLWLDLPGFRAVHACWNPLAMQDLWNVIDKDNRLIGAAIPHCFDKKTESYNALETVLKGMECDLPKGVSFVDKDGTRRYSIRVKWWDNNAKTFTDVVLEHNPLEGDLANARLPKDAVCGYAETEKPLFVGHYWLKGHPARLSKNVACLDYSIARGGHLVAYRFDGESEIFDHKFVAVAAPESTPSDDGKSAPAPKKASVAMPGNTLELPSL